MLHLLSAKSVFYKLPLYMGLKLQITSYNPHHCYDQISIMERIRRNLRCIYIYIYLLNSENFVSKIYLQIFVINFCFVHNFVINCEFQLTKKKVILRSQIFIMKNFYGFLVKFIVNFFFHLLISMYYINNLKKYKYCNSNGLFG